MHTQSKKEHHGQLCLSQIIMGGCFELKYRWNRWKALKTAESALRDTYWGIPASIARIPIAELSIGPTVPPDLESLRI